MGVASKVFQVRLDARTHDRIRAIAKFRETSINATVGDLLRRGVAEIDGKDSGDRGKAKRPSRPGHCA